MKTQTDDQNASPATTKHHQSVLSVAVCSLTLADTATMWQTMTKAPRVQN